MILAGIVSIGCALSGPLRAADSSGDAAIAGLMAECNTIETWTGLAVIEDRPAGGTDRDVATNRVEFAFDRQLRRSAWKWRPEVRPNAIAAGRVKPPAGTAGMIRDHALYERADRDRFGRRESPSVEISEVPSDWDPFVAGAFDPLHFLTLGFDSMPDLLRRGSASAGTVVGAQRETQLLSIERGGDGQTVRLEHRQAEGVQRWTAHQQRQDGIWTPREIRIETFGPGGNPGQLRSIRFEGCAVNREIPRDKWTLESLGARPGDLVRDRRAGVQYVFRSGSAADEQRAGPAAEQDNLPVYLAMNVAAWCVVLGVVAAFARRRGAKPAMSASDAASPQVLTSRAAGSRAGGETSGDL